MAAHLQVAVRPFIVTNNIKIFCKAIRDLPANSFRASYRSFELLPFANQQLAGKRFLCCFFFNFNFSLLYFSHFSNSGFGEKTHRSSVQTLKIDICCFPAFVGPRREKLFARSVLNNVHSRPRAKFFSIRNEQGRK